MEYQDQDNNYDYDYQQPKPEGSKAAKGLTIVVFLLLLVLAGVSYLYWKSVQEHKANEQGMIEEMDTLKSQYQRITVDLNTITFDNDTLNRNLIVEKHKADSIMSRLKQERSVSYTKLKAYEKELGTLRKTMQGFVRQIDSLNRLNEKLVGENLNYRKQLAEYRTKTEVLQETAQVLNSKVVRGAVIKARDIALRAVNNRDKDVTRARQADKLVTSFILSANELATPGERAVFVRIINPEGFDLSEAQNKVFKFEGRNVPYAASRSVDYQLDDLSVSLFYTGSGLTAGKYTVMIYMDGNLIGSNAIMLK